MADLRSNHALNEADPAELTESEHVTGMERHSTAGGAPGGRHRATCECGWRGPWRRSPGAAWKATADADEHCNDNAEVQDE